MSANVDDSMAAPCSLGIQIWPDNGKYNCFILCSFVIFEMWMTGQFSIFSCYVQNTNQNLHFLKSGFTWFDQLDLFIPFGASEIKKNII
jgi:hypothetical protein